MPDAGDIAPDFTLTSDSGEQVTLSDFRGKPVVLYFYPKDDTPGCTTEACGFRDAYEVFRERGAVILGVSPDDESSHARFREKYGLPFTLLADPDHAVAEAYDAWGEKTLYGKKSLGMKRTTYVIGPDGTIVRAMRNVRPDGHPEQVLAAIDAAA